MHKHRISSFQLPPIKGKSHSLAVPGKMEEELMDKIEIIRRSHSPPRISVPVFKYEPR